MRATVPEASYISIAFTPFAVREMSFCPTPSTSLWTTGSLPLQLMPGAVPTWALPLIVQIGRPPWHPFPVHHRRRRSHPRPMSQRMSKRASGMLIRMLTANAYSRDTLLIGPYSVGTKHLGMSRIGLVMLLDYFRYTKNNAYTRLTLQH